MTPNEIKKIQNLPMYYLSVRAGEHQFYQFRNYYDRQFNPDGSYEPRRTNEVPAEGFTNDFKPQWPNCSKRTQGMYHTPNDDLKILCMCRHQEAENFTKIVSATDCQNCPLKGR